MKRLNELNPALAAPAMEFELVGRYLARYKGRDWQAPQLSPGALARLQANHALTLVLEHRYGDCDNINVIEDILLAACASYPDWKECWYSPLPGYGLVLALWLVQLYGLREKTRWVVRGAMTDLADYWAAQPLAASPPGNSACEEHAWRAGFLAMCAHVFPGWDRQGNERAERWRQAALNFAYHTFTHPLDAIYDKAKVTTIDCNGRVENHGYDHPSYGLWSINGGAPLAYLRWTALPHTLAMDDIPTEVMHNIWLVWNYYKDHIDTQTWRFTTKDFEKFGGLDDWGVDATWQNHSLAWLSFLASFFCYHDRREVRQIYHDMLLWELEHTPRTDWSVFLPEGARQAEMGGESGYSEDMIWLLDSIAAKRHVEACLLGLPAGGGSG